MSDDNDPSTAETVNLPIELPKPSFIEWAESYLPFMLPRLALPQAAKNFDKAAARILEAGGDNAVARIGASTVKKTALGKGTVVFIEEGLAQAIEASASAKDQRAAEYFMREAGIHQSNREKIFELAAEDLATQPNVIEATSEISDDWLNTFSRIASEKSDVDIQQLWARLLAGEIRGPGSVKLRTLSHLATFDRDDANFAYDLLKNSINSNWIFRGYYESVSFYKLALRAAELGLIGPGSRMNLQISPGGETKFFMSKRVMQVFAKTQQNYFIDSYPLTSFGSSLCGFLRDTIPDDEYYKKFFDVVKNDGVSIIDFRIGHEISPDKFAIISSANLWPIVEEKSE